VLVALLFGVVLAIPAADLGAEVAEVAASQEHLPLYFVGSVAPRLEVVLVERPRGLAMAFYAPLPPAPAPASGASAAGGAVEAPASAEARTEGPEAKPRLVLNEPYYRRQDGSWVPPIEMTPDVVEYWSHALLLAHLHLEVIEGDGEYGALLKRRAVELYPEVEADAALGLMVTALASFGSHVLSLANEVERLRRRRPERDLCSLVRGRRLHFASWERAFIEPGYVGVAAEAGGERYPQRAVSIEDRRAFVRHVLDDRWSGDAVQDFGALLCGESKASTEQR
jgi:hypothetical protein